MAKYIKKFRYSNFLIIIFLVTLTHLNSYSIDGTGEFEKIVKIAFKSSPEIKKAYKKLKAAEGDKIQAAYFPNPEFDFEVENFGRGYGEDTFSNADITFYITQKIETGGKRKYRKKSTQQKLLAAQEKFKSQINSRLATIYIIYNKTAIAKKRLKIAEQLFEISKENLEVVSEKVKYGKTSPIQKIKAKIEFDKSALTLKEAKANFENMKNILANLIGTNKLPEDIAFQDFEPKNIDIEELTKEEKILNTPQIKEKEFLKKARETELKLTKSLNIPDLNLSVGLRKFRETDQTAYVVSVGFKIPIFNRNRGLIMKRAAERDMAYLSMKQAKLDILKSRENILNSFKTAREQNEVYKKTMLPDSEKAYQSVFTAYREGKLNYLDLLDTQRTLIFIENEYLSVKERYIESLGTLLELSGFFSDKFLKEKNIKIKGD